MADTMYTVTYMNMTDRHNVHSYTYEHDTTGSNSFRENETSYYFVSTFLKKLYQGKIPLFGNDK